MRTSKIELALLALLGPTVAFTAHAEVYMSPEQAVKLIFPGVNMTKTSTTLTDDEVKRIEKLSDENVRSKKLIMWHDSSGDVVYIDQVLGKHEFITLAVGFTGEGKIKDIEILEYRETYGSEVRRPAWRAQFSGKTVKNTLKLGKDIKNISGATLSSLHITNGVRRLAVTNEVLGERHKS